MVHTALRDDVILLQLSRILQSCVGLNSEDDHTWSRYGSNPRGSVTSVHHEDDLRPCHARRFQYKRDELSGCGDETTCNNSTTIHAVAHVALGR